MKERVEKFLQDIELDFYQLPLDKDEIKNFLDDKLDLCQLSFKDLFDHIDNSRDRFAFYIKASLFLFGVGCLKDCVKAFSEVSGLLKTEPNYGAAINLKGVMYYQGWGVIRDYRIAFDQFCLSVEKGFLKSLCNEAICFYYGHGVTQNVSTALSLLQEASEKNVKIARSLHAHFLIENDPKDKAIVAKAKEVLIERIREKDNKAKKYLALALLSEKDQSGLEDKYVCDPSIPKDVCFLVAEFLIHNYRNDSKSLELAINLLNASSDYKPSLNLLAYCYQEGIGVTVDIRRALNTLKIKRPNTYATTSLEIVVPSSEGVCEVPIIELKKACPNIPPPTPSPSPPPYNS